MCREEKTFSRNDALTRHIRVVHPDVEAYRKRGRQSEEGDNKEGNSNSNSNSDGEGVRENRWTREY